MKKYILSIDQSTQGTKGLLFDEKGRLVCRKDLPHRQIIDDRGFVEHDPEEILSNTLRVIRQVVEASGADRKEIAGIGISNQRETALVWDRKTGKPVCHAVVWQCARGEGICREIERRGYGPMIKERTGLNVSPYFSAAKISWIFQNVEGVREKAERGELCAGTMDSWLVWNLTGKKEFRTDYSNASRTQLFDILDLKWNREICDIFGIPVSCLAELTDSNGDYGVTTAGGFFETPVPIHSVLGDSHGALYGQGCLEKGMSKATYGTGSSIMMNIGETPIASQWGLVTSLAWSMDGTVHYVLEGNINYSAAVISWMKNDLQLLQDAKESEELAFSANPQDQTYLVPAFTGLGAPYWNSEAAGMFTGMTRTTKRAELVRAGLDCIAYQITDVIRAMAEDAGIGIQELRVDGGATGNRYLMQFQSDIADLPVQVSSMEELSGIGAAYAAGIALGLYDNTIFSQIKRTGYQPKMEPERREQLYTGWKEAVARTLYRPDHAY